MAVLMEYELVTQDVDLPSTAPYLNKVDLVSVATGIWQVRVRCWIATVG